MCLKRMALMSGGRSTLNPNAPLFVPAAFRQVEDFSPEWWQLITTSPWYHDYWLSQHQDEDDFYSNEEKDIDNVAALLPETFDFDAGDEFSSIEAQLEEFIQFSEAEGDKSYLLPSDRRHEKAGLAMQAETLVQSMKYLEERSPKNQAEPAKYAKKAAKFMTTKYNPRRIQQPR